MGKKIKYQDQSCKTNPYSHWESNTQEYGYDQGNLSTPHGYVKMYAQGDERFSHVTRLTFIWRGYQYERQWQHRYSRQYMVTLAKRFVAEIIKNQGTKK